jgi:hypothetical protein
MYTDNHCYTVCTLIKHCYTVCTLIKHCYTVRTLINHCHTVCTLINHFDPIHKVTKRAQRMKEVVGWDDASQKPTRPRNHGGAGPGKKAAWEYNSGPHTLDRSDDAQWSLYEGSVSKVQSINRQSINSGTAVEPVRGVSEQGEWAINRGSTVDPQARTRRR